MDVRVARTRASVLRTATDLLVEGGPSAVTIDAIVARSGVAKSTIYRHWATRDDVLVSVIEGCAPQIEPPDESLAFEDALRALTADLVRMLNDPHWARVLPALLVLRTQKHGIADLEQRIEKRQEHAIDAVLRRGFDEGVLAPDVDVDEASALLVGPLLMANLMGKPTVDDAFCDKVVEAFLRTYAAATVTR
jgi:AcrR family transcriptional regulator